MAHPPERPHPQARRPPGGLRHERPRARSRRRLFSEARVQHADASRRIRTIDEAIESLVDERLAFLDVLVECRDQLRIRFGSRHSRRRATIDEAPFPGPPPAAKPLSGIDLRSVALTILRRHGPQRLRDLHALIHLYGYLVESDRPVQRLADAMAYELSQGRVERLERGVYTATNPHPGPDRYEPPPCDLDGPLPWSRPVTEPGPPHLDPDVAHDPELWSGSQWPTEDDLPDEPPEPDPQRLGGEPPATATSPDRPPSSDPPAPALDALGDDSPTNRRPGAQHRAWRQWEPPP